MVRIKILLRLLVLLLILTFNSCKNQNKESNEEEMMLFNQIENRLIELEPIKDSLKLLGLEPQAIHQRFQDFLLLSKDIENLQASVNLSNQYMNELCAIKGFNSSAIQLLNTQLSLKQISLVLKQNELNILNQIVLQKLNSSVNLETAR